MLFIMGRRRIKYALIILCAFCILCIIEISIFRTKILPSPKDYLLDVGHPFHPKNTKLSLKCIKPNRTRTKICPSLIRKPFCEEVKYISTISDYPGGLGNIMWRFASLYGIGQTIGREVYLDGNVYRHIEKMPEIAAVFPHMNYLYHIKFPPDHQVSIANYAKDCCKYEDPIILNNISAPYLQLATSYLQSYQFFKGYKEDMSRIFKCGKTVMRKVESFVDSIFDNDDSFKLCVHTRRGDFLRDSMLESKLDFVQPALKFVVKYLQENICSNISLIIFGDDEAFIHSINVKNLNLFKAHAPKNLHRGETMCLGINYCDAMLMTASGSTFAWWISYLMPENAKIFYNSQISDKGFHSKDVHDFQIFPQEWIKLTVENSRVKEETNWWYERNNWTRDKAERFSLNKFEP